MFKGRLVPLLASLVAFPLAGCGADGAAEVLNGYKDAKLESAEDLKHFSGSASAATIFFFSLTPMVMVDLAHQSGDTSCPAVVTEGTKKTYKGDCTDKNGNKWIGTAVSEGYDREKSALSRISYEGFGYERTDTCNGKTETGSFKVDGEVLGTKDEKTSKSTFEVNIRVEGRSFDDDCTLRNDTLAFDYVATFEQASNGQKWSGEGQFGSATYGKLKASTVDQVINQQTCRHESLSGKTTLESGNDTVVVTYDGATDCDEGSTAQWSLNGQAQGELAGIGCSAGGGGMSLAWGSLVALLALLPRRRRG